MLPGIEEVVERLRRSSKVKVVTHIDADGIASGAVATEALQRLGKEYEIEFFKSLTPEVIERLLDENPECLWFTDLGSGSADRLGPLEPVITDHHVPTARGPYHLNCHFLGEDGARFLSGATTTYFVVRALSRENRDLSQVALVGAVGDLQDIEEGRLVGLNRVVLEEATTIGRAMRSIDARFYGRETRSLLKLLQYADDPCIPGVTGRYAGVLSFLESLSLESRKEERWVKLDLEERRRILSSIARRLLTHGYGAQSVRRLVGEVIVFPHEKEGTPARDPKEFATLLNGTARYGEALVGLAVARGDRESAWQQAMDLLRGHRTKIVQGLEFVSTQGLKEMDHLQYFDVGSLIPDTVVGIVAGMLYRDSSVRNDLVIVGFADSEEGWVKVSARASPELVRRGVSLSEALRESASVVGGSGGGHAPAAGATIPQARREEFLLHLDRVLGKQMRSSRSP